MFLGVGLWAQPAAAAATPEALTTSSHTAEVQLHQESLSGHRLSDSGRFPSPQPQLLAAGGEAASGVARCPSPSLPVPSPRPVPSLVAPKQASSAGMERA